MNPHQKPAKQSDQYKFQTQMNRTDLMIGRLETRVAGLSRELKRLTVGNQQELLKKILPRKGREA